MKKSITYISLFTAFVYILCGCSDDFLEKKYWNPALQLEMYANPPLLDPGLQSISFTIPNAGNSAYKLIQYPSLMANINKEGNASNDIITLDYNYDTGQFSGYSIPYFYFKFEIDGIGQVGVLVTFEENKYTFEDKDLFAIEGVVKGAVFDKANGLMYIATQEPDLIVIYDVAKEMKSFVSLPKAPKCIKLSENGGQLFIGHSGLLSILNTQTKRVETSINVDYNIFDLVYGENEWCYASIDQDNKGGLYGINIKTKDSRLLTEYWSYFYDHTYLNKIKGKALLVGSGRSTGSVGVLLGSISNPTDVVEKRWPEDYGRLWFSEDYDYIYSSYGKIFKTPNLNTDELFVLNSIGTDGYWHNFQHIEHSKITNSIWATGNRTSWDKGHAICRYDCTNYSLQETIYPAKSLHTVNGELGIYSTSAYFLFVEKNGSNLYLIKNIFSEDYIERNGWSVQKIKLN